MENKNWTIRVYFVSGVSQIVKSFGNDKKAAEEYAEKLNDEAKSNGSELCYDITPWAN